MNTGITDHKDEAGRKVDLLCLQRVGIKEKDFALPSVCGDQWIGDSRSNAHEQILRTMGDQREIAIVKGQSPKFAEYARNRHQERRRTPEAYSRRKITRHGK
jgi:hypothetical protein